MKHCRFQIERGGETEVLLTPADRTSVVVTKRGIECIFVNDGIMAKFEDYDTCVMVGEVDLADALRLGHLWRGEV